jgi:hypothetical protein
MLWVSRVLAAVIVLIGPVLLVYARSDLGLWSSWAESIFLFVPFAFHAFAAFGYVLAAGVTRADASAVRTAIAAVGCLIIPFAMFVLSLPMLAVGTQLAIGVTFVILALPTAAFQVLVMGRRRPFATLEFLSHPCATGGAFLVGLILSLPLQYGHAERIFQSWPILLALTPFVALAVAGATAAPLRRLAFACIAAATPVYAGMTVLDARDGHGAEAALWPVRVWTDFISASERLALFKTVTRIRAGVPVRIGEHWYRFERPGIHYSHTANVRRPDRIASVQLDIPAADLDLPEMRISRDHIQLNISTAPWPSFRGRPEETERGGRDVAIADRDLSVYVVAPLGRDVDRAEVRRKLTRFIQNARVEPPAGAVPR